MNDVERPMSRDEEFLAELLDSFKKQNKLKNVRVSLIQHTVPILKSEQIVESGRPSDAVLSFAEGRADSVTAEAISLWQETWLSPAVVPKFASMRWRPSPSNRPHLFMCTAVISVEIAKPSLSASQLAGERLAMAGWVSEWMRSRQSLKFLIGARRGDRELFVGYAEGRLILELDSAEVDFGQVLQAGEMSIEADQLPVTSSNGIR